MASNLKNIIDLHNFTYEDEKGFPGRHPRMAGLSAYKARKRGFKPTGEPEDLIDYDLKDYMREMSAEASQK